VADISHPNATAVQIFQRLLKSPAVINWEALYRRSRFLDKSITFDNRLTKAPEHYTQLQRAPTDIRKFSFF
jgi:hypothetical protein